MYTCCHFSHEELRTAKNNIGEVRTAKYFSDVQAAGSPFHLRTQQVGAAWRGKTHRVWTTAVGGDAQGLSDVWRHTKRARGKYKHQLVQFFRCTLENVKHTCDRRYCRTTVPAQWPA